MGKDGEVVFNDAAIQRILNSPAMQAEVKRVCDVIMSRARVLAPVRTGAYVNSFSVEIVTNKKLRAVGYVHNHHPAAMKIESIYGVLTRARRARG